MTGPIVAVYRNAHAETASKTASMDAVMKAVREGRACDADALAETRRLYAAGEKKARADHKAESFKAITIASDAPGRTGDDWPERHTGLICVDLDGLGERLADARAAAEADPSVGACFTSLSGDGLAVVHAVAPLPLSPDAHGWAWEGVRFVWEDRGYEVDTPGKAFNGLRFVCNDADALGWREPQPFEWAMPERPAAPPAAAAADLTLRDKAAVARALTHLRGVASLVEWKHWLGVGMAMKAMGMTLAEWESLFAASSKKQDKDYTAKRWDGFDGKTGGVASIVGTAKKYGHDTGRPAWKPEGAKKVSRPAHYMNRAESEPPPRRTSAAAPERPVERAEPPKQPDAASAPVTPVECAQCGGEHDSGAVAAAARAEIMDRLEQMEDRMDRTADYIDSEAAAWRDWANAHARDSHGAS